MQIKMKCLIYKILLRGIKLEYGEYCIAEMDENDGKGNLYLKVGEI